MYFDLYTPFRVENLDGLSSNSPMQTENHRAQIFYLLVFDRSDYSGILNIPRFFGFSREPGFYVMFTIPGLLIASFFKMKFQAISLAFATFISSSFAGFFVLLILVFIFILPKSQYKKIIFLLLGMLMLIILLRGFYSNLNIARVDDYVYLIDRTLFRYTSSLTSFGGMLFLLPKLTYLLIIYHYYRKTMIINLKIALMFFIAIIILLNKATELISPLFLFYLSFIDFLHKSRTCLESSESRKTN